MRTTTGTYAGIEARLGARRPQLGLPACLAHLAGRVRPSPRAGRFHVPPPAFLFDLDGTLVDSVYQHVVAWQEALTACGIPLSVWRIHRRIGMSGGLFLSALQRETGLTLDAETLARLVDVAPGAAT